ncbi:hypothetical protein GCM10010230_65300 [Streptomyces narbonensis]|nr:hypothetical protein GCM10010230_65300 [Streptomyces narbonensis]
MIAREEVRATAPGPGGVEGAGGERRARPGQPFRALLEARPQQEQVNSSYREQNLGGVVTFPSSPEGRPRGVWCVPDAAGQTGM